MTPVRVCTSCDTFKKLEEFARKKDGKDGHASRCKRCAAYLQALYRKTPKGLEAERNYVLKHLDIKLAKLKQWRQTHRERLREIKKHKQPGI